MKRMTIARGVVAVLLCAGLAFGDEDSDKAEREQLIEAIKKDVEQVAANLYNVDDASSDDGIENAMGYARQARDKLDKLGRVKGSDSTAGSMVDRYPGYIDDFYDAAKGLIVLKNAQLQQEQRGLWKSCSDEDDNLKKAVKQYLDPPDPDGLEKIPALAEAAKGKIHSDYDRLLDKDSSVISAYSNAKDFSVSDGPWSSVTSRLREAADDTAGKYDARLKETKKECAELDKGKDSAFIVESLGKLKGAHSGSKQVLEDILKDWGAWKELRRELAAKYVVNADKVRMAMCDGDEEHILSRVEDAEKSAQGNLLSGYQSLDKELDQLIARVDKLENDKSVGAEARKWRGVMRGAKTRLAKVLSDGGMLQGVSNAKVRARIEIGQKKHKDYQGNSSNCTDDEVQVSSGRIDCVRVESGWCNIIEIKPNNDKAVSKGWDQVKRYRDNVLEAWRNTGSDKTKIQPEVFRSCISDDDKQELRLKVDVVTYDFCPVPEEDIDAMYKEQVAQSSSTSDQ
jgi:hypothetical protein